MAKWVASQGFPLVGLVPAAAVVFFSSSERVHLAKAGAQAERSAHRSAAVRAQATLTKAEVELAKARADANKARGQREAKRSVGAIVGPNSREKRRQMLMWKLREGNFPRR
jgi:hypothetical protein